MNRVKYWATPMAMATLIAACAAVSEEPLPLRSDCIVRIDLVWPEDTSTNEKIAKIDEISFAIVYEGARIAPGVGPSQAFPKGNLSAFFLQFTQGCDERLHYAELLVDHVRAQVSRAPELIVSGDRVEPGDDTIQVWGPDWRDGID